jgi:hypothetical protein
LKKTKRRIPDSSLAVEATVKLSRKGIKLKVVIHNGITIGGAIWMTRAR